MKRKWKIIIILLSIVLAIVIFLSLFVVTTEVEVKPPPGPISLPRPSPEPADSVDSLLKRMEFGHVAFNAPRQINIADAPQIQLRLSLHDTFQQLKRSITEEGERIGARIQVSNRMEARLTGYMFEITAITPEVQAVSRTQPTEWRWELHAREPGQHRLHLTLSALLDVDGESTPRTIRTFDKMINVDVTTSQRLSYFIEHNWQWLWAAILVPLAGWLWRRRKKEPTL